VQGDAVPLPEREVSSLLFLFPRLPPQAAQAMYLNSYYLKLKNDSYNQIIRDHSILAFILLFKRMTNMNKEGQVYKCTTIDDCSHLPVMKRKLDLVLLRYMAQRIQETLRLSDPLANTTQPQLYLLEERHQHTHRIVIYKSQELLRGSSLVFVGFISGKQKPLSHPVLEEMRATDKMLITDLASNPGLLSYSSLQLCTSNWCNLVLLSDASAKTHFRTNETHKYAARQLAPRYYEWIRLHTGVMPGGLVGNETILRSTKFYTFQGEQLESTMRELVYQM
jgi:hypothetical protein